MLQQPALNTTLLTVLSLLLLAGCSAQNNALAADQQPGDYWVYVGTYTGPKSQGIQLLRLDSTGALTNLGLAAPATNPTFLAIHPNQKFLYAVGETSDFAGQKTGSVSAFAINPTTGKLTLLNQQPSAGRGPCYVTIDATGKNALVANYGGGTVSVLPIADDGKLSPHSSAIQHTGTGPNKSRQEAPHAHSINLDPSNQLAIAADLGIDKLLLYRLDPTKGTLTPSTPPAVDLAPGSGPRHFTFHTTGQYAYLINEMASTITAFSYDPKRATLTEIQTVTTLPEGFKGNNTTAEVRVHPSGRFLYGSNRGHDSIAIFAIDPKTGKLTPLGHQPTLGKTPRNFNIDPTGHYLLAANQSADNVVVFTIHPQTGLLTPNNSVAEVGAPVCLKFLPMTRQD
jgi:6-phosphogluconolactonase